MGFNSGFKGLIQIRSYLPVTLDGVTVQQTVLVLPLITDLRWGNLLHDMLFITSALKVGT
jgi:hypothetical protein